ncbi:serine/threonine-protein kinase Chk1-like [Oratosquilla oratoria]|uniref:serine/threonine-protein kinase Chk1-like n=1 Tax=Oratosquilla oratoria TaxID=337810 RepID=UPI003F76B581
MFFNCCRKSKGQEGSSSEPGKDRQRSSKSSRKIFSNLVTRLTFLLGCVKSSEKSRQEEESPDVILDPNNESFMDEALIHFQLNHINIIKLHCWNLHDNTLSLFMEYCSGGDIKSNIDRIKGKEALNYFSQLMDGVAYLHSRGVAHRDLKPENLLLNEEKVLKIADLGLADVSFVNGEEVQLTGTVGSRAFMAPEVIECTSYYGPPVDLWSCGVIYFNLTTKGRPWEQASSQDNVYKMWLNKDEELNTLMPWCWLSETCRKIVDILLEPNPQKRLSDWQKHRQG